MEIDRKTRGDRKKEGKRHTAQVHQGIHAGIISAIRTQKSLNYFKNLSQVTSNWHSAFGIIYRLQPKSQSHILNPGNADGCIQVL